MEVGSEVTGVDAGQVDSESITVAALSALSRQRPRELSSNEERAMEHGLTCSHGTVRMAQLMAFGVIAWRSCA